MEWRELSNTHKNVLIATELEGWKQHRGYFNVLDENGRVVGKSDMIDPSGKPAFVPNFVDRINEYINRLMQIGWNVDE